MKYILSILLFLSLSAQGQIVINTVPGVTLIVNINVNSLNYGSLTYTANTVYLAVAFSRDGDAAELPTVAGTTDVNFTQVATATYNTTVTGFNRTTIYRYLGTSDKTETVTATWPETQSLAAIHLFKVTGCDLSGTNGSGSIVQSVTNNADATTNPTIAIPSINSRNSVFCFFTNDAGSFNGPSEGGWTELTKGNLNPSYYVMYQHTAIDNTPTVTDASTNDWAGIAIEIKAIGRRRINID